MSAIFWMIMNFLCFGTMNNRLKSTLWMPNFALNPMVEAQYTYALPLLRFFKGWYRIIEYYNKAYTCTACFKETGGSLTAIKRHEALFEVCCIFVVT